MPTSPGGPGESTCEPASDRLLVRFKESAVAKDHANAYGRANVRAERALRAIRGLEVVRAKGDPKTAVADLASDPDVLYAEPDCRVSIDLQPNDPLFPQQWNLRNTGQTGGTSGADIRAATAWNVRTSAAGLVVGVIDTGIQANHPDLAANVWVNTDEIAANGVDDDGNGYIDDRQGYDFLNADSSPADDNGHGTHVSGTIGAVGNNGLGVSGVAWTVKLMPLKAFDSSGNGSLGAIVEAIDYAIDNGAMVLNHSYSTTDFSRAMYDAFAAAESAGIVSAAAAGNTAENSDERPRYPSSFRLGSVLSVAATTDADALASFSNFGVYNVHLAAPGQSILSTWPGSTYASISGTSMATPHVTGVAALLAAAHPTWTALQIRDRILGTTRTVSGLAGMTWTGGVLDAGTALSADASVAPPAHPAFTTDPLATSVIADPNPAPAEPPPPPTFPSVDTIESRPVFHEPPVIALDAAGKPSIAYADLNDGIFLWSKASGTWEKQRLSAAYDDFYWLDLAMDSGDVPVVAVQRMWSRLDAYWDPGIVLLHGTAPTAAEERLTASCPALDSCFQDWEPSIDYDASGDPHVAFARYDSAGSPLNDKVVAPAGSATASGSGIYYATKAGSDWVVTRLTTGATDDTAALTVEDDGTAHLLFRRRLGSGSGLYYATNEGGAWTIRRLTDFVQDDNVEAAVDAAGVVHVAFTRRGLGLYYMRRTAGGSWSAPARVVNSDVYQVDIAADAAGKAHVVVGVVNGYNTVDGVRYATNASGSWVVTTIATGETAYPRLAIDGSGHVHIAYEKFIGPPHGLYYATNASGSFQSSLVEARSAEGGNYGGTVAHAIDDDGYQHIAAAIGYGSSAAGLYYGTNRTGSWALTKVSGSWPSSIALRVDANHAAHIAFSEWLALPGDTGLPADKMRIGYATNSSGSWVVETARSGAIAPQGIGMDFDSSGQPVLVFPDYLNEHLLRARRIGGTWQVDTIFSGATAIRFPSLLLDPAGKSHIAVTAAFAGEPGARLLYLTNTTGTWVSTNLTDGQFIEDYATIRRAPDGSLWVVNRRIDHGIWVRRRASNGTWSAEAISTSLYDTPPTFTFDALGTARVVYPHSIYYGASGCATPMCATGPGLIQATYTGSTWETTRVTPQWLDTEPAIAAGSDGSVAVVFYRLEKGLRSIELSPGGPNPTLRLAASSDSGTSATDGITNSTTLTFDVTFNRAVTGVATGDFARTGTATGCLIGAPSGSGATYTVSLTGCSAGTVVLKFGANGATDGGATGPIAARAAPTVTIDRTPPAAAAPTLALRAGTALTSTSASAGVLTQLQWSATDAGGAGVASYDVARSLDGAAFAKLLGATGTTASNLSLAPAHTYRYEVRAKDKAGNLGPYVAGPTVTPSLVQQTSGSVTYTGTWTTSTSASFSNGTVRYATAAGASASYTFTGRGIAFVTTRRSTTGKVKVYVDGVLVSTIDTYRTSTQYRYVAFARTWTTSGTHTLKLVVSGTSGRPRVDLDALEILQ